MELFLYGITIFFLVSGTVYFVLAKNTSRLQEQEPGKIHSSWAGYYAQQTLQGDVQGSVKLMPEKTAIDLLRARTKQAIASLFADRASNETEVLYFVLQFLMHIESGMTVISALKKTQSALETAGYGIAGELQQINFKLRGGVPFAEAVKVLENKGSMRIMKEFFLVISQAQEIGVPVAKALKNAIKEFEELRVIRAEERASRLSVLLAVPIVFGFLPAILLLVLMPAAHGLFKAFG